MKNSIRGLALVALCVTALSVQAEDRPLPEGFLCCSMRSIDGWISDINYNGTGAQIIPAGTPVKATGYGRYRVHVLIDGKKQDIGNDYSRDIEMGKFAERYIVKEDPKAKMAKYPEKIRAAIKTARVMVGMTREQVVMAVGYPISSENPNLDADMYRYWLTSFGEYDVLFDKSGHAKEITTDAVTRNFVVMQ